MICDWCSGQLDSSSKNIKQLTVAEEASEKSSSNFEVPDDITVIEIKDNTDNSQDESTNIIDTKEEGRDDNKDAENESDTLSVLNRSLTENDTDFANQLVEPQDPHQDDDNIIRDKSFDSIKEEKSKKSISFR